MVAKNFLDSEQRKRLQRVMREADCPRLREHALMLLLKNDGKTYREIADFIGCGYTTVAHWCVHGNPDNLDSLKDQRKQGNHQKVTDHYIQQLLQLVQTDPHELGYDFGHWSLHRLSNHLTEQTGIKLSGAQISRILKRKKQGCSQIGSNSRSQKSFELRTSIVQLRCNAVGWQMNAVLKTILFNSEGSVA